MEFHRNYEFVEQPSESAEFVTVKEKFTESFFRFAYFLLDIYFI